MASVSFLNAVGGNGSTVTDDANPLTGLRRGGYKIRFVPALEQMVAVASFTVLQATNAAGSAAAALLSQNAAAASQAAALASQTAAALSASNAATSALAARLAAGESIAGYLGQLATYANLQAVDAAIRSGAIKQDDIVIVLQDSRYQNSATFNLVNVNAVSLNFDFGANTYAVEDYIEFAGYYGIKQGAVPATSTGEGVAGTLAFNTTHLFLCIDTNQWRRVALETF